MPEKKIYTTQQTSKKWKVLQLIGLGIILLGGLFGYSIDDGGAVIFFFIIGLTTLVVGVFLAWWHHG